MQYEPGKWITSSSMKKLQILNILSKRYATQKTSTRVNAFLPKKYVLKICHSKDINERPWFS